MPRERKQRRQLAEDSHSVLPEFYRFAEDAQDDRAQPGPAKVEPGRRASGHGCDARRGGEDPALVAHSGVGENGVDMAISLNRLRPAKGSTHKKKRVGRGPGSGLGKTAGRGEKGQKSRSGYSRKIGFEGGQMPLASPFAETRLHEHLQEAWLEVSLAALDQHFNADEEITPEVLHSRGLIKKAKHDVVVLGNGEVSKPLRVSAHRFTKSARRRSKRLVVQ